MSRSSTKQPASRYATSDDFREVFTTSLDEFYKLAFLLTGDSEKAEQAFVAGIEDSVKSNHVFKEWAHSWAKRVIIKNAIRLMQPHATDHEASSAASAVSEKDKLRIIRDGHLEIDSVLALEDFERFVFVMTVLERYSDHDAALLIGCSMDEIRAARVSALEEIAVLASTDSSWDFPLGRGPHHLPLENTPR